MEFQTAVQLCAALRERRISSRELLDHYLRRVDELDSRLGAVVTLDVERARDEADRADAALARGESKGPLHGLPMTVKDVFETAGLRTTAGVPELSNYVPETDAVAVSRLRSAGAVIFGKTNTPTWALDWQTTNPIFGTTVNPWNARRSPGGSSGGSAAAMAAGLSGLELGSDIGGSIRLPSHWSGVFGHKPSHGLVPQRGHLPGLPGSLIENDLNVVGPLARGVDDLELALDVMAGPLPDRARAWRLELPPARRASLREYRVAAWFDEPACPVDATMRELLESAVGDLRREGAQIDSKARPQIEFEQAVADYLMLLMPQSGAVQSDEEFAGMVAVRDAMPDDVPEVVRRSLIALVGCHRDWLRAHQRREQVRLRWAEFFRDFDILLCPVTLTPAIEHDHGPYPDRTLEVNGRVRSYMEQIYWPGLITMALLPVTVIPVGRTRDELPVGIQIVGPFLEDRSTLDFARRASQVLGGFEPPPGV